MSKDPLAPIRSRFTWPDMVVLVAFECVAVPICIAAGEAFVSEHYARAFFGWAIGIPLAVGGFTAHWWKDWLNEPTREWILRNANRWWPAAILVAFVYVVGPSVYQRAIAPTPSSTASVSAVPAELAAASPDNTQLAPSLRSQLAEAQSQRDQAIRERDAANQRPLTSPPPQPSNQLNAAIEVTKGLSSIDRERLSDGLYDLSNSFDQTNKLATDINQLVGKILTSDNDYGRAIAGDLDMYNNKLAQLLDMD